MVLIKELKINGYKKVIEAKDEKANLHCIIAVHSTELGPSLGGTRIYPYESTDDALEDVLALSKAMTYKAAVAKLGIGGGKSVIIADSATEKTEDLLLAFAEVVDSLKGDYIAAEDVGSTTEDMAIVSKKTPYVAGLKKDYSSGDPSRFTAWGVFKGMQAVAQKLYGSPSLKNKRILIQGLGSVGSKLADLLFWEGAELLFSEINEKRLLELSHLYGAKAIGLKESFGVECDILSPCALGGAINEETLPLLKCKAIAGAANNQLETLEIGQKLLEKSILYAPDYVINTGGLVNAAAEFNVNGYNAIATKDLVDSIYDTLLSLFTESENKKIPTNILANQLAEHNLLHHIGKRKELIQFRKA